MSDGHGIFTKDEVAGHELGLRLKVMVVTAEHAQTEELAVGNGEPGVGGVVLGEVLVGMRVGRFVVDGG